MDFSKIQMQGTEFALGAGVALFTFIVLYALAIGLTFNRVTMPGAIPIEVVVGLLGVVGIIIAALLWARREPESPAGRPKPTEGQPEEGTPNEQQPRQTHRRTEHGSDSGSVNTARNANIANDNVRSAESGTNGASETTRQQESTGRRSHSDGSTNRNKNASGRERPSRDSDHRQSENRRNRSQHRSREDPTDAPLDTEDSSELPESYRRELAKFNSNDRTSDE